MKKELRRSFLQKNEIDDCMVELLKKYGSYIRAKAISAVSNEAEREELTAGIIVHLYEKLSKMGLYRRRKIRVLVAYSGESLYCQLEA